MSLSSIVFLCDTRQNSPTHFLPILALLKVSNMEPYLKYVSGIYMLVLDISCQHLGDECKLEGFCVPFGHRVGESTFLKIYLQLI